VPFVVDESGLYELSTQVAQAPDYGQYEILVDGAAAAPNELEHEPGADIRQQNRFDGYAWDTYVGLDRQLGWRKLDKGRHTLTFVCLGRNPASSGFTLGVDNVILARVGADGWAHANAVREPKLAATDVPGFVKALESDPDSKVRTQAALAIAARPKEAAAALPALEKALKDPSPFVREAAPERSARRARRPRRRFRRSSPRARTPLRRERFDAAIFYALGDMARLRRPRCPSSASSTTRARRGSWKSSSRDVTGRQVGAQVKRARRLSCCRRRRPPRPSRSRPRPEPASRLRFTVTYGADKSATPLDDVSF
jgi:hypothetical protein